MDIQDAHDEHAKQIFLLATQRAVFCGAIAVVGMGLPLDAAQRIVLADVLQREGVSKEIGDLLLAKAATGCVAGQIELNSLFTVDHLAHYLSALTLLAIRCCDSGKADALSVPEIVAQLYGINPRFIHFIAGKLRSVGGSPSLGLAEQLEEYLDPSSYVDATAQLAIQVIDPSRAPKRNFARISPSRIQHPLDKKRLDALQNTAGCDDLVRAFSKHYTEKMIRIENLSTAIRVGPKQFPDLYAIFQSCVARVGIKPEPEFYVQSGGIGAYTNGVDRKFVVLESGTVSLCTRSELEYIIGHELGHIACQHVLYHMLAQKGVAIAEDIPLIGGLLADGLNLVLSIVLFDWFRASELSADRFGLLACQDLDSALRTMMKWSGAPPAYYRELNVQAFLDQAADFDNLDDDFLSSVYKTDAGRNMTHPWTVLRAAELKRWHDKGEYAVLFNESAAPIQPELLSDDILPPIALSPQCSVCHAAISPDSQFCEGCGAPRAEGGRDQRCRACGTSNGPLLKFCEHCGENLSTNPSVSLGASSL